MAKDDDLLTEIRERFTLATDGWRDIRAEGARDMQYVGGDPWDEADKAQRKNRPTVAPDELHQYYNQVVNKLRANPLAMKFDPTGADATEPGAQFYTSKAREVEYRSHAQRVYVTAAENAIQRSYGWARVNTRYVDDRSFDQEIWIEDIPNPDMVLPDPHSHKPDSSDMQYLFFAESRPRDEFAREFPDAKIVDFGPYALDAPDWIKGDQIVVAEYWTIHTTKKELLLFQHPQTQQTVTAYSDEVARHPAGSVVVKKRVVDVPSVCQYLTNGVEILQTTPWLGKYIPFVSCFGKVIYVDGEKRLLSMTRAMREPWKLYCYYRSQQAEMAGMTPKVPVTAYEGQMAGWESEWQKVAHEPVPFLYFKGKTPATGDQILPPPGRLAYSAGEHLQALELCAEGARRAIQAAAGSGFLPTSAQRRNEKSGIALKKIDENAEVGSFHFNDHYRDLVRQVGVIFEDLADKVYDTMRDVGIRHDDDTTATVRINDPQAAGRPQANGEPPAPPVSTKGDYLVTVSAGESFDSERAAAADFAEQLLQTPAAPLVMDLITKMRISGPIADQLVERLTPPQFKKPTAGAGPDPQQIQQQLAHGQQENQQLKGMLGKLTQEIQTKQAELASREKIAGAEIHSKERIADLESRRRAETAIAVAELGAKVDRQTLFLEERARIGVQQADAAAQVHDAAHEVGMAQLTHQQALDQAQQAQQHALAQGAQQAGTQADLAAQGHQQALAQGQQAAALAPAPEAQPTVAPAPEAGA